MANTKGLLALVIVVCLYVGTSNWLAFQGPQSNKAPEVFSDSPTGTGAIAQVAGGANRKASLYYRDDAIQPSSGGEQDALIAEGLQDNLQRVVGDNKYSREIIDQDRLRSGPVDYGLTPNHIGLTVDPDTMRYAPIDFELEPQHEGVARGSYIEAEGPIDYGLEPQHIGTSVDPDLVRTTPVDRGLPQNHVGTKLDPYHERAD